MLSVTDQPKQRQESRMSDVSTQASGPLDLLERQLDELENSTVDRATLIARFDEFLLSIKAGDVVNSVHRGLDLAQRSLVFAREIDHPRAIAYGLAYSGFCYYLLSSHETALRLLHEAQEIFNELADTQGLATVYNGLAGAQLSLGNYEEAWEFGFKSMRLAEQIGNKHLVGWSMNGIGLGYQEIGDLDRALEYHQRSLDVFEEVGDRVGAARALVGIGAVHQSRGEFDLACDYNERALVVFRETGNRLGEARALNDLGLIAHRLGRLDRAMEKHREALAIREDLGNRQARCTSLINIGNVLLDMKRYDEALDTLHRALTAAMEIKAKPRVFQAHQSISEVYVQLGLYDNALEHYRMFHAMKEEVAGDQANSRIRNIQISVEVEKAEREAEINRLRNVELRDKNEQLERLLTELKETQSQLIQSEKMAALGSLVAGVVHELNSPLGTLTSAVDVVRRSADAIDRTIGNGGGGNQDSLRRALTALRDNARLERSATERIMRIVEGLRSFAHLDEASFQRVDVHEGIESCLILLEPKLSERIAVNRDYGEIPKINCYPGELNQAFMHLLTNAVEAIEGPGEISIATRAVGDRVEIVFHDTGAGIPADRQERLFEPVFNRRGARIRTGMGLFTSYNIVRKHEGEISVDSEPGRGSTFTISLPTGLQPAPQNNR
ncbi:tetratricopeptide repeat protein [candidate division GN15 bacterium]|nr:tetratricopeptide repeat protein [candidate division GN15 bacterium]